MTQPIDGLQLWEKILLLLDESMAGDGTLERVQDHLDRASLEFWRKYSASMEDLTEQDMKLVERTQKEETK